MRYRRAFMIHWRGRVRLGPSGRGGL